jgi:hypothetical protein
VYASGLDANYAAPKAGLPEPWSNGQTEGQVNKPKLLKRQVYGRANIDLLRLRVVHAARSPYVACGPWHLSPRLADFHQK